MHIETTGYINIETTDYDKVDNLVDEFQLSNMECHETEILTDVDKAFVNRLKIEGIITKEQQDTLMAKCDVIKFYT